MNKYQFFSINIHSDHDEIPVFDLCSTFGTVVGRKGFIRNTMATF